MKSKNLKKKMMNGLLIWIVVSIAGAASIPLMIVGLVNNNWFIAAPCIAIVSISFFAIPMGWSTWVTLAYHNKIATIISDEEITSLKDLCATLDIKEKEMRNVISVLLSKRYLTNVKWNDDKTKLVYLKVEKKGADHCTYCGATFDHDAAHCPSCGAAVH